MTEDDKQLVRDSWAKVMPISDKAAELFYNRLFELDPSLRPLFTSDITEQGRKLMRMITVAVNGLDHLDEIIPAVRELGKRHSVYGVTNDHYDTVATALLWTLERGLGDGFNEDTRNAWIKTYTLLSTTMKEAAAQPATA
jgi:hemoglobin-like flavoprotein